MISLTFCLYVAAGLAIGVLSAFAVHNRRSGWKKPRTTLTEALEDLYADLGLNTARNLAPAETVHDHFVIARREEVAIDSADFSDQLLRLKIALGDGAVVALREREIVETQTR